MILKWRRRRTEGRKIRMKRERRAKNEEIMEEEGKEKQESLEEEEEVDDDDDNDVTAPLRSRQRTRARPWCSTWRSTAATAARRHGKWTSANSSPPPPST